MSDYEWEMKFTFAYQKIKKKIIFFHINIFLIFLNYLNVLILKIIFKN
jgi:hypothetical protein